MPAWSITGRDVGGFHGAEEHRGGRLVLSETLKADTMPGVWGGTHHGFHDGTLPPHARDRARNRWESAAIHPDGTPTPGVRRELSADNGAVPLSRMPGILLHMERPEISLQQAELRVSDQDTRGAPQPPP